MIETGFSPIFQTWPRPFSLTPDQRIELAEQLWESLDPAVIGPSTADAELLRARRGELVADGDPGEPWRQTIQELKTRGA